MKQNEFAVTFVGHRKYECKGQTILPRFKFHHSMEDLCFDPKKRSGFDYIGVFSFSL